MRDFVHVQEKWQILTECQKGLAVFDHSVFSESTNSPLSFCNSHKTILVTHSDIAKIFTCVK